MVDKEYIRRKCAEYYLDKEITRYIISFSDVLEHWMFRDESRMYELGRKFLRYFKGETLQSLSWETMCKQLTPNAMFSYGGISTVILPFYKYLLDQGVYLGDHTTYLKGNPWLFEPNGNKTTMSLLYYKGLNPENLLRYNIVKYGERRNNSDNTLYIDLNTNSIRELLRGFISYRIASQTAFFGLKQFAYAFEKSIEGVKPQPQKAQDFNYRVFDHQFKFLLVGNSVSGVTKRTPLGLLKEFYLYLLNHLKATQEDTIIFPANCGIDEYFLLRLSFTKEYAEGGRVVLFNPFDKTPTLDVWILAPNGNEEKAIGNREAKYHKLDFRRIKDANIRTLAKDFIWKHESESLYGKQVHLWKLSSYFEWAEQQLNLKTTGKILDIHKTQYASSLSEILFTDYYLFLKLNKQDEYPWIFLKLFVRFLKTNGHSVSDLIFDNIQLSAKQPQGGNPLSPDEVDLLLAKAKELERDGDYNVEILFIIIQLLLSDKFRIQELLATITSGKFL